MNKINQNINNNKNKVNLQSILQHIAFRRMLAPEDKALHFILGEKWTLYYISAWLKALRYRKSISDEKLKRVFFLSYSRSGSHNFAGRLHYLPNVFVFGEHAFTTRQDPWQQRIVPGDVKTAHYLSLSVFGPYGIQHKQGRNLDYLVFFSNRYLDWDGPPAETLIQDKKSIILFYSRNIFRVLFSRDKASERVGKDKSKWKVTDASFERDLVRHRSKLLEMIHLHEKYPGRVAWCFHEMFCAQPDRIFREICRLLGEPEEYYGYWDKPKEFFKVAFGNIRKLEERDKRLWCPVRKTYVEGTGGHYNPLLKVDKNRSVSDPLEELITPQRRAIAESVLGKELTNFWLNDKYYSYSKETTKGLLEMIKKYLPGACESKLR